MLELINLYFFYTIFIFSSIGYGLILTFKINRAHTYELGFIGLSGIFILIIVSYLTNFVFKHGYVHPTVENINIYPLLAKILNLKPAKTDGKLENVSRMLKPKMLIND